MSHEILIDRSADGRTAAALMVGGRLEDLLIDPPAGDPTPIPGEIYRARIDRLVPKLGAAFVRLSRDRTGFLREAKGRKEGEALLVQVVSYAEPGKASPVTARILHKGRTVIHTPDAPGINVSRQIRDPAERARLTEIGEAAMAETRRALDPARAAALAASGLILRSAAAGAPAGELAAEAQGLLVAHLGVLAEARSGPGPAALAPVEAAEIALRDWTDPLPARVRLSPAGWDWLCPGGDPGPGARLGQSRELFARCARDEAGDLFERHGVAEEIDRLRGPRVDLPGGASMRVEPTAALVAVDVNTGGGFQGGDALAANLAAARELPRQLRLRGLGGIVAVDVAPLAKKDRRRIEDAVGTALRRDPVETALAGWTPLGLLELSRKRERRPLAELL